MKFVPIIIYSSRKEPLKVKFHTIKDFGANNSLHLIFLLSSCDEGRRTTKFPNSLMAPLLALREKGVKKIGSLGTQLQ